MVMAVLDEAINLNPEIHRSGYGGLVHVINHAAAVTDLVDYGYVDLASRTIRSHRHHLRLWRNLPNVADEKGPLQVSKFPATAALITHCVKTIFGFDELTATVDEEANEKAAYDKLRYMM